MCQVTTMKVGDRTFQAAEIKQKYIVNIVNAASECTLIEKIILFGSSIESRCRQDSDIDIAVFGNETEYKALRSGEYAGFTDQIYKFDDSGQAYDILYFVSGKKYEDPIMNDIQNGELIYARG